MRRCAQFVRCRFQRRYRLHDEAAVATAVNHKGEDDVDVMKLVDSKLLGVGKSSNVRNEMELDGMTHSKLKHWLEMTHEYTI